MSASITIGSLSLAANGKTLTATLSGGTGTGYAPSSGVTGLVVTRTSGTSTKVKLALTVISSTTLTLTLDTPLGTGETLTVDLSASSNLTDSGSNTATGQSGVSATNSSTKAAASFSSASLASGVAISACIAGKFDNFSFGGHSYYNFGPNCELNLTVTGASDFAICMLDSSCSVTVDGGSPATSTATNASAFELTSAFSGLSDSSPHTVRLLFSSPGLTQASASVMFHATGTSTPTIAIADGYGEALQLGTGSTVGSYIARDSGRLVSAGGYALCDFFNMGSLRHSAKTSIIRGWLFNNQRIRLWTDGVAGSVQTITVPSAGLYTLFSGLDNTAYHEYRIEFLSFLDNEIFQIMFDGVGLALVAHPLLTKCVADYGDSTVEGNLNSGPEVNFPYLLGEAQVLAPLAIGQSGQRVSTWLRDNVALISGCLQTPTVAWTHGGSNDVANSVPVATFEADYVTMIKNERTDFPNARLYFQSINDATAAAGGSPKSYSQAIIDAVATVKADVTVGNRDKIHWVPSYADLLTGVWDGTHPTASQMPTIVWYMTPFKADVGYTTFGTSGTVTVNIAAGGKFAGTLLGTTQTITLAISAGTPTITVVGSVVDNLDGTWTVTPDHGETGFTYTNSANATIIYIANVNLGWVNPPPTSYSATDTTPPTVTLATPGTTLVMTPSEAITGVVLANFAMTGGHTLTGVSGSGAGPYTFTLTPPIAQGETVTGSFTAANTVFDTADVPNAMATFSGKAITNTSTLTVPDAPILTGVLAAVTGISMDIEAGASDGGSAIIDYQVWHNRGGAGYVLFRTILAANIDNVAYTTDTGTLAGELVKIKVRCRNLLGYSPFCAETVDIESAGPPPVLRTSLSLGLGIGI